MLFWLLLGALCIGAVAYTVSYTLTRHNILDTVKDALNQASTSLAKKALASTFQTMVKEKGTDVVKVDVLVAKNEKLEVTIQCSGVSADVYKGMVC